MRSVTEALQNRFNKPEISHSSDDDNDGSVFAEIPETITGDSEAVFAKGLLVLAIGMGSYVYKCANKFAYKLNAT